jgi:hypothetical protein
MLRPYFCELCVLCGQNDFLSSFLPCEGAMNRAPPFVAFVRFGAKSLLHVLVADIAGLVLRGIALLLTSFP